VTRPNAPTSAILVLLATVAGGAALAVAQPDQGAPPVPPSDPLAFAPAPPALEIVDGDATVIALVQSRSDGLLACARQRATFVRARVRVAWTRKGKVRSATVSGGSAAFNRCATRLLRTGLAESIIRAGSGRASLIIRPGSYVPPTPKPPTPPVTGKVDIQACTVDSDCVVHFRSSGCFPGDPVGVNQLDPAQVQLTFPVKRMACGMGGPQYEQRRMADEGRYSAACEKKRCVVHDAGPRPTPLDGMKL